MALTRVEIENFTAFRSLTLEFCPGVNVLIGANGTGKAHLMKVCHAACEVSRSHVDDFLQKLIAVFLRSGRRLPRLVRRQAGEVGTARICVERGALKLESSFEKHPPPVSLRSSTFTTDEPDLEIDANAIADTFTDLYDREVLHPAVPDPRMNETGYCVAPDAGTEVGAALVRESP